MGFDSRLFYTIGRLRGRPDQADLVASIAGALDVNPQAFSTTTTSLHNDVNLFLTIGYITSPARRVAPAQLLQTRVEKCVLCVQLRTIPNQH
jgi:hypothetical protein